MLSLINEKRATARKLLDAEATKEVNQEEIKSKLVKAILTRAKEAGRIVREA
jgi:hypothetical protein